MENNILIAIIAVSGTLAGVIISTIGTYIVQSKSYEREKKREREKEQREIRREVLSNRLNIIEESANIMMFLNGLKMSEDFGDFIYSDKTTIQEKRKRLEEISGMSWTAIQATDSADLKKNYGAITHAYWQSESTGAIGSKEWNEASEGFVRLVKIIDDMKAMV